MGYRKKNKHDSMKKWSKFIIDQETLFSRTELPYSYYESEEMFDDFLMHGYIDHHQDHIRFTIENMSVDQYLALEELVETYFRAGYKDPGVIVIPEDLRAKLVKKYDASI